MIYLLSSLYFLYGFVLFYSYVKGYSLLRYLLKRKNINAVLTIELVFIILCSFIVFTSQPLNWVIALIMFTHVSGVIWLISNPEIIIDLLIHDFYVLWLVTVIGFSVYCGVTMTFVQKTGLKGTMKVLFMLTLIVECTAQCNINHSIVKN